MCRSRRELSNEYLLAKIGVPKIGVLQLHAHTWVSSLFSFRREGLDDLACLLACVDTAENEPLEVWGKIIQYYSFVSLVVTLGPRGRGRRLVPLQRLLSRRQPRFDLGAALRRRRRCRLPVGAGLRRRPRVRLVPTLALTQLSNYLTNYLTLKGSFSAVSKPNFASKYALESSRRDLHNALLCTVLVGSVWVKKYTKINIL